MANDNTKTRLDPGQVIKRVYDPSTESIRTLTEIAIADIVFEVHTDASNDSTTSYTQEEEVL